jgi:DNA polymerase III psi subunit
MNDLLTLKLLDIDVWLMQDFDNTKICSLYVNGYNGLLFVNNNDLNSETRELLKKMLQAFKFKVKSSYDIESVHNFVLAFGDSFKEINLVSASKVFLFPELKDIVKNTENKKKIWRDVSTYLQKLK